MSHVFSSIQTYLVTITLNNKFQRKQAAQQVCVQDNIEGECIASSFQRSHAVLNLNDVSLSFWPFCKGEKGFLLEAVGNFRFYYVLQQTDCC